MNNVSRFIKGVPWLSIALISSVIFFVGVILVFASYPVSITGVEHVESGVVESDDAGSVVALTALSESEKETIGTAINESNVSNGTSYSFSEPQEIAGSDWETNNNTVFTSGFSETKTTIVDDNELYLVSYKNELPWFTILLGFVMSHVILIIGGVLRKEYITEHKTDYHTTWVGYMCLIMLVMLLIQFVLFLVLIPYGPAIHSHVM